MQIAGEKKHWFSLKSLSGLANNRRFVFCVWKMCSCLVLCPPIKSIERDNKMLFLCCLLSSSDFSCLFTPRHAWWALLLLLPHHQVGQQHKDTTNLNFHCIRDAMLHLIASSCRLRSQYAYCSGSWMSCRDTLTCLIIWGRDVDEYNFILRTFDVSQTN